MATDSKDNITQLFFFFFFCVCVCVCVCEHCFTSHLKKGSFFFFFLTDSFLFLSRLLFRGDLVFRKATCKTNTPSVSSLLVVLG